MATEAHGGRTTKRRPIPLDELPDHYPDQWVLLQISERSGRDEPVAGIVLATGSDRHVQSVLIDRIRAGGPDGPYTCFFARRQKYTPEEAQDLCEQIWIDEMTRELKRGRTGGRERR